MSDDADRTQDRMEREEFLRRKIIRPALEANPTGYCLNCDEPLTTVGTRWCDNSCRDDWEHRKT
jgi:hypothetical protein